MQRQIKPVPLGAERKGSDTEDCAEVCLEPIELWFVGLCRNLYLFLPGRVATS